jgi:hypothetical protein
MKPPSHIHNIPRWEEHCSMIRARALDFIEGRLSVIETARELSKLIIWTGLGNDADLEVFVAIDSETGTLPVGDVRKHWAKQALEREDVAINKAEDVYRAGALEAAQRLVDKFEWTLEARRERRRSGHTV